ncbi:cysteine-rich receptor-like protein kinase 8 [Tanacetum coccineum]
MVRPPQQPPIISQQLPVNTEESSSQTEDTNSTNHPLFLHLNDHLGLILISKKLLGLENYSLWRRSMTIALNAKNKLKIITKDYPEHDSESPLRALWERNNDMIISWIFNIVSDQISNNLSFVNTASALWLKLQEHYSQLDGHRIYQLSGILQRLEAFVASPIGCGGSDVGIA